MITPKYTGFYKPGLALKAAELSLRQTTRGVEESVTPVRLAERHGFQTRPGSEGAQNRPARAA
jgi:hypothetical protein